MYSHSGEQGDGRVRSRLCNLRMKNMSFRMLHENGQGKLPVAPVRKMGVLAADIITYPQWGQE